MRRAASDEALFPLPVTHALRWLFPAAKMRSPAYTCPTHHESLTIHGEGAHCRGCAEPYAIRDNIWILDPVSRADRAAFDEQVENAPISLDLEKGATHLDRLGLERLAGVSLLDIGCGLGDLTYGLAVSDKISNCDIYAIDHSLASLRRAAAVVRPENGNRVYFSTQDASRMFFRDGTFDVIFGCALLHHITDYPRLLGDVFRLLRAGGRAVFSEPFLEGYFWPAFLLDIAVRDLKLADLGAPQFGLSRFILDNIGVRTREMDHFAVLDELTDKHLFTAESILTLTQKLGYRSASFFNSADDSYYQGWMAFFLDVYRITDSRLRQRAIELYGQLREYAGPALPKLVSHFKFIVLEK
jgi:ubiquinone/menaquinone biosynthesis C-methylase UbiE